MLERMHKTGAEVSGCPQRAKTESERYVGAQTCIWMVEDNVVEVPFVEKPRDFDPFGQTGLPPLAAI